MKREGGGKVHHPSGFPRGISTTNSFFYFPFEQTSSASSPSARPIVS